MAKMKLKSNRSASKRLKVTGTGKVTRHKAGNRHLLTTKDASRKRSLTGAVEIDKANITNIKRLIPYGID